jgi:IclR family acetate operon transcriptional repressor
LHLGAGKAIAVDLTDDELAGLAVHLERFPDASGVGLDAQALAADLDGLRRNGHHISVGERAVGVIALSVPVRTRGGELLGALSIAGPSEQEPREELQARAGEVVRAGAAIAEAWSRGL